MGITNKTDGKSSEGNISDKFTQRSKENDSYSEHDPTETFEYQKEQSQRSGPYFLLGALGIIFGIIYLLSSRKMDLNEEREKVYKRLQEREEEKWAEQERMTRSNSIFRDD